MHSIKEIFVIGYGPSSSHTMGPANACKYVLAKYQDIKSIKVTLFGSLASTGKGHLTDYIIDLKLKSIPHEIIFDKVTEPKRHPNTLGFEITTNKGEEFREEILSIGGGTIITEDSKNTDQDVYPHSTLKEIIDFCEQSHTSLADYVRKYEDKDIDEYIRKVIKVMDEAIKRGIETEGYLPGSLKLKRKAPELYKRLKGQLDTVENVKSLYDLIMIVGAFATSEENASGGKIVTAPTCGSSGVIPGCLAYLYARKTEEQKIVDGMMVAGLIGMLCKTNGSISGAEAGCQAEIGVACAMGAALIAIAKDMGNFKASEAAEIALEHSLGLTCDPVKGYVQIPCIERCAMYALKAKNAVSLVKLIPFNTQIISFDDSVKTMYATGKDLACGYKETSQKGLAELIK